MPAGGVPDPNLARSAALVLVLVVGFGAQRGARVGVLYLALSAVRREGARGAARAVAQRVAELRCASA